MTVDRIEAVTALLSETEAAHGTFEGTVLQGVYDQEWPRWYADYIVEHGIGGLVGHPLAADRLAEFLGSTFVEFEAADPKPTETWVAYAARRIAAEL